VINAGKSTHNEDQASCEVLSVKKKPGGTNSTPNKNSSTKRRSSLPNGEGLQLRENSCLHTTPFLDPFPQAAPESRRNILCQPQESLSAPKWLLGDMTVVSCNRFTFTCLPLNQESDGFSFYYWSLFDGHAGSGAAVVASKLLQHHIAEQLQDIVDILKNSAVLPPTCLGEEPESLNASSRTLTRAASLRGSAGPPGSSPGTPPTRFFTEKKISHECLVMGAIETAFREMVSDFLKRLNCVWELASGRGSWHVDVKMLRSF
ncbi:hypothetical protein lerEdw1_009019, partial [Lerista edwardsae]